MCPGLLFCIQIIHNDVASSNMLFTCCTFFAFESFITYCLINTFQRKWVTGTHTHTHTNHGKCNCFISWCQWWNLIGSYRIWIWYHCVNAPRWLCIPFKMNATYSVCQFCVFIIAIVAYKMMSVCHETGAPHHILSKLNGMRLGLNQTISNNKFTSTDIECVAKRCRCSSFKMCHKFSVWVLWSGA